MVTNESINPNKLCFLTESSGASLPLLFATPESIISHFFHQRNQVSVTHCHLDLHRGFKGQTDEEKRTKLEPDCCFSNFSDLGADQLFQWEMCTL